MIKNLNPGYIYALICILLWSFIPVVSRFGQTELDHYQFLFWSNALSLIIVTLCLSLNQSLSALTKFSLIEALYVMFLGALGCAIYYLCLYYGYAYGQGLEVLVLQYTWPIIIIILSSALLSERLSPLSWIAVIIGFLGIAIVLSKGNLSDIELSNTKVSGIVLFGAFCFALFSVLSKKFNRDPYSMVVYLFSGGLITSTIGLFIASSFQVPQQQELLPVILNGALINGISYIFWLKALEKIPASISAVLVFLTPTLSAIWIVIFFKEPFYSAYPIGLSLVILSGYVCVKLQSRK